MPQAPDLRLPEPYLENHPLFKLQVSDIQRWVDALPKANLGESCRQLQDALIGLNKLRCSPKERFTALETLRPSVHLVLKGMSSQYLYKSTAISAKNQRLVEISNNLNSLLSNGYALIVLDLNHHRNIFKRRTRLRNVALHRAMAEQSLQLLRWLQLHKQEDRDFWLYLHRLYFFVADLGLQNKKIEDPILGSCSLHSCYLRALMLVASNPYQLTQDQLQVLFTVLPDWAEKLELRGVELEKWSSEVTLPQEDFTDCLFVFNPSRDSPPAYQVIHSDDTGCIGINTDSLIAELVAMKSAQASSSNNSTLVPVDANLLKHLMSVWSAMRKRRFDREPREGKIDIAFGFTSAHFFVAGNLYFEDFIRQARTSSSKAVERAELLLELNHDVEQISYGGEQPTKAFGVSKHYKLHCVELRDSSARGYCIVLPEKEVSNLRKDDLVSLREEGETYWSVGVIRWIRQKDGSEFEAGIDLLGAAVEPFQAKLARLDVSAGRVKMAFVFPRDILTGQPQRILLENNLYHKGDELLVESPGQSITIQLHDRLEAIGRYELFSYEFVEQSDTPENREPDGLDVESSPQEGS